MQGARHVPELVGVTHDIDSDDAAILDLQGGGLENVAPLDGDEPRQAVDKAIMHEPRPALGEDSREGHEQPHDVVESGDRRSVSRRLAAAIGIDGDVRREQRAQALHLAISGRGEEGFRDLEAPFPRYWVAWAVCTNMGTGATCQLATRGRISLDRGSDLLKAEAEHVMQQ